MSGRDARQSLTPPCSRSIHAAPDTTVTELLGLSSKRRTDRLTVDLAELSTQLSFARAGQLSRRLPGAGATGAQVHNAVAGDAEIVAVVTGVLLPAQSVGVPEWIDRLSPFTHLALVPEMPPDWAGTAGLSAAVAALMIISVVGYTDHDLAV